MGSQENITHLTQQSKDELQKIAAAVASSRKSIVISGAGISTSAGIPVSYYSPSNLRKTYIVRIFALAMGYTAANQVAA